MNIPRYEFLSLFAQGIDDTTPLIFDDSMAEEEVISALEIVNPPYVTFRSM